MTSSFAESSSQSPDQTETLLSDAKSLFQQGKFPEADRAVRQYLENHPNSADGHFLLGHILFREIQTQAALEIQLPSRLMVQWETQESWVPLLPICLHQKPHRKWPKLRSPNSLSAQNSTIPPPPI